MSGSLTGFVKTDGMYYQKLNENEMDLEIIDEDLDDEDNE